MRLVKLTMLAATAAAAALMLIGVSSASAAHQWIALCKEQTLLLCPTASLIKHPLLGRVLATVGEGLFKSSFESKCKKGMGKSNLVESQQEKTFKGTIEELNFSECTGGCKAIKVILPQAFELNMESESEESWRFKSANMTWEFFECTFGVKCKFEGTLNLKLAMDAEGMFVDPEGTSFKLIEGSALLCGSSGKWESGRIRLGWLLDDAADTIHSPVWLALAVELVVVS